MLAQPQPLAMFLHLQNLVISRIFYEWNHTVWDLSRLAFLTQHASLESHPDCCMPRGAVPFYCYIVFHHGVDLPQFNHSSIQGHVGCFQYLAIMNPYVFIKLVQKMPASGICVLSLDRVQYFPWSLNDGSLHRLFHLNPAEALGGKQGRNSVSQHIFIEHLLCSMYYSRLIGDTGVNKTDSNPFPCWLSPILIGETWSSERLYNLLKGTQVGSGTWPRDFWLPGH